MINFKESKEMLCFFLLGKLGNEFEIIYHPFLSCAHVNPGLTAVQSSALIRQEIAQLSVKSSPGHLSGLDVDNARKK